MKQGWEIAFWDPKERPILVLITRSIFDELPNGTILYTVKGEKRVKGTDEFDMDTRAGFLAYGFHLEHKRDALGRGHEHDNPHEVVQVWGRVD